MALLLSVAFSTVPAVSQTPAVLSVTPSSGSGANQSFSFEYSDPSGFGSINAIEVMFSPGVHSNSCDIWYDRSSKLVYLMNDAGTSDGAGKAISTPGAVENSQCSVDLGSSSESGSGNGLTVVFAITFEPSFTGQKNIWTAAHDVSGGNTGFVSVGSWTVTASTVPPTVGPVTPNSGTGASQTFSFQYSDSSGWPYIGSTEVMFNPGVYSNSCDIWFDRRTNLLYLMNDAGTSDGAGRPIGTAGTLQNSQCTVNTASSSVTGSGNLLTVKLAISFSSAFNGQKNVWSAVHDVNGGNSGFVAVGTWTVNAVSPPTPTSVSPNSGSGTGGTFVFQYSDANGWQSISATEVMFNPGVYSNSCDIWFDRQSNSIYLMNDSGTSDGAGVILGTAGTLQNSQCTVNAGASSASGSGNVLSVALSINFEAGFVGNKNIWSAVHDDSGTNSGFVTVGTWTVTASGGGPIPTAVDHVIFMMQENRTFDNYFGMLNPYRKANGWNIGDDGNEYDVDGLDGSKANISNPMDENTNPNDTTTTFTPFKFATTCTDDMSSAWLESFGDVNRYDFSASRAMQMNGFVHNAENEAKDDGYGDTRGKRAMGYFDQGFLNYYYFMASQFAVSDRWFSPVASKTIPNRLATMTGGTTQGLVYDPSLDDKRPQLSTETIFQELDNAGVSWKIYYTDTDATDIANPPDQMPATTFGYFTYSDNYMYNNPSHSACNAPTQPSSVVGDSSNSYCIDPNHIAPLSQYFTDLQNGTLPQFAYIEPGYNDGTDEHPAADVTVGQQQVANIINAFMGSSSWSNSVFFLSYDEGGGPFDHVPPVPGQSNLNTDSSLANVTPDISGIAVNPDSNPNYYPCQGYYEAGDGSLTPVSGADLNHCDLHDYTAGGYADPGWNSGDAAAQQGFAAQLGFRLPNMVISPFTRRHYVSHIPMDHTAIIKFVENRFIGSGAHLTNRDAAQPNLLDFFDFNAVPWATPPSPPTPASGACSPEDF